jgi:hypothetical protein
MTTHSGHQYILLSTTVTSTNPVTPVSCPKWSHNELFGPLSLPNTQGGLHDLPKKVESWIPKFSGEDGSYGKSHWTDFCYAFQFHQSEQEHPDVFTNPFGYLFPRWPPKHSLTSIFSVVTVEPFIGVYMWIGSRPWVQSKLSKKTLHIPTLSTSPERR